MCTQLRSTKIYKLLTDLKGEIDSTTIIVGDLTPYLHHWIDPPKSTGKYWP